MHIFVAVGWLAACLLLFKKPDQDIDFIIASHSSLGVLVVGVGRRWY